ncbi:MAG: GIY-YIG nuclease family protein, partial [Deltaproteobacteria bacterium]|nr:GIY-YIG nuclease family protein [Deltaproteobacteria bacterium]
ERIQRHNKGRSKYTKSKRPWELVYYEEFPDRSSFVKRENEIKTRKRKAYIENLIRTSRP